MALSAPVKVLLIVMYTAAVAAGAFGIGYAVFDSGDGTEMLPRGSRMGVSMSWRTACWTASAGAPMSYRA